MMTVLRNVILGVIFTLLLLGFLAVTRLIFLRLQPEELVLTKLETIRLAAPPEPPSVEPKQKSEVEEMLAVPLPPPALADLRQAVDMTKVTMPSVSLPQPLNLSVEHFSLAIQAPEELANVPKQKKSANLAVKPSQATGFVAEIGMSDLDSKPTVLRLGRLRWPSRARVELIKAVVKVELNEKGNVKLLEIKSVSDESVRRALTALVNGSKFSIPHKNGQAVKVIFNWPLILKKP